METIIPHLSYRDLCCAYTLATAIYPNRQQSYYWSVDFSPHYYIAQAKAGFISVRCDYDEYDILLPNIHDCYAVLDFEDLHISRKVRRLLKKRSLCLEMGADLEEVYAGIAALHEECWLSREYLEMLQATRGLDDDFEVVAVALREGAELIAGEIGYIIGSSYTSLTGFSRRERQYRDCGTAQLVLLAQHLEEQGFTFWNLGDPSLEYKLALGARLVERDQFLGRWFAAQGDTIEEATLVYSADPHS